jgi:hypothetical protein
MSIRPLTDAAQELKAGNGVVPQPMGKSGTKMTAAGDEESIKHLLDAARCWSRTTAWVVYRAGEQLHLVGQGDAGAMAIKYC